MTGSSVGLTISRVPTSRRIGIGIRFGFRTGVSGGRQRLIKITRINSRIVKRVASTTVRQCQFGRHPDVLLGDGDFPRRFVRSGAGLAPGGVCHRSAGQHQIGSHPVDIEGRTQRGDPVQLAIGQFDIVHPGTRGGDPVGQFTVLGGVPSSESDWVGLVVQSSPDHRTADRHLTGGVHVYSQTEPIEKLRAQFALFGIHGADQDEA